MGGLDGSTLLIIYIAAFFVIYYMILIRPQQKRSKERRVLLSELKVNDEVITFGGLHGKIKDIREGIVILQIDENVRVKVDKDAIGARTPKEEAKKAAETK
ncbi:MAG: preprotein translocase subunit YajC [Actinomycetota bacterium]|nr:preprotein translocase subunit YajC [Actinomycetota bacterium]